MPEPYDPNLLLERFTRPPAEYGPLPIWWWSGARVTRERLRWQMEQLVTHGVHQAVVMCLAPTGPLFGSLADDPPFMSPEWWELFDGACEDADRLGFRLWVYDQIGFSGANLQGQLIARNPEFAGMALRRDSAQPLVSGFDYFNPDACAALIDTVHGEFERRVGHWFGRAIGGFFQDELPPMPTWGRDFAPTFQAHYGYDLTPHLSVLWDGADDDAARTRRDYQEHRARLARLAFFDPLADWFAKHSLQCGFDQPTPAREGDPVGGVQVYGDYLGTHSRYGAPGSDHWGDSKIHSSLAHALGHGRTWIEAFHSSGWGGTLEETYDWLAPFLRRGATLYDPHAVYYSTVSGWWEWAPPSTCWRQPYWPSYDVFATAVARLCSVLSVGTHVCDTVLLTPTTNSQAYLTLDGPLPPAAESAEAYHALNGVNAWTSERRGALERAGVDHDVLDETLVAGGTVDGGALRVGEESYRNVVLPAVTAIHVDAADRLAELAEAGGLVVCVGRAPAVFLGGDAASVGDRFTAAVEDGRIRVVGSAEDSIAELAAGPVLVNADAPFLLRRAGDTHLLALTAHDEHTGTAQPILDWMTDDWWSGGFDWNRYWRDLHDRGYSFRPPADRIAHVRLSGFGDVRVQRWDPRTGRRSELPSVTTPDGESIVEVPFSDGPVSMLVIGAGLPAADTMPPGDVVDRTQLDGPWRAVAESTLDNQWGDLAGTDVDGIVPIQVWRFEHFVGDDVPSVSATGRAATASFGPFGLADGHEAEWSLSRGIQNDPIHADPLGPKGYVPEEFVDWRSVDAGGEVTLRTHLALPAEAGLHLAVGSNAERQVYVDDVQLPVEGDGYLSFTALPAYADAAHHAVEIRLRATETGPLRTSFAVVRDTVRYVRPEWMVADGEAHDGRISDLTHRLRLDRIPDDTVLQVGSDAACGLLVNGIEVGRQGDFNPYPEHREIRVHPYDVRDQLRVGDNEITLRVTDTGTTPTAALIDSTPVSRGGLGVVSGPEWTVAGGRQVRLRRKHPRDPRFVSAWARPHPLPGASWLEPAAAQGDVVLGVVPDLAPGRPRVEWLRLAVPAGTTTLFAPTDLEFGVLAGGIEYRPAEGRVTFPAPLAAGEPVLLRFHAVDGRRGGALLAGPAEVRTAEVTVELVDWERLGLRSLGGQVRYRTTLTTTAPGRATLDLGEVRGTADVLVNGVLADRLVWGPWRADVTGLLVDGDNEVEIVVRGTLAGYLDDASPTSAVAGGQVRTGLFGPVALLRHEEPS